MVTFITQCGRKKNENVDEYHRYLEIAFDKEYQKPMIMPIVSKCACSTLCALYQYRKSNFNINSLDSQTHFYFFKQRSKLWNIKPTWINKNTKNNYFVCAVIRDPLERLASAYNTLTAVYQQRYKFTIEEYIESLVRTFQHVEPMVINKHVQSQFYQYNINLVDMFVRIEDLDMFLRRYFKEDLNIRFNCSRSKITLPKDERLMKILERDFEIYEHIINGDRIYRYI